MTVLHQAYTKSRGKSLNIHCGKQGKSNNEDKTKNTQRVKM